jgi:CDP-diacylglycerol--glycerol-3-phosphate 3-phosphatidyltransferase
MAFERDPKLLYAHDRLMAAVVRLVPRSVRPNHVTILRLLMTPVVLWLIIVRRYDLGVPLFFLAAFTDVLDGSLARLRHQISAWGTFYDPVADKLLIGSVALVVATRSLPTALAVALISIETVITTAGVIGRRRGRVVSANVFGKAKMFLQVTGLGLALVALWAGLRIPPAAIATLWASVVLAFFSLLTYGL